jgi:hypothetical protein
MQKGLHLRCLKHELSSRAICRKNNFSSHNRYRTLAERSTTFRINLAPSHQARIEHPTAILIRGTAKPPHYPIHRKIARTVQATIPAACVTGSRAIGEIKGNSFARGFDQLIFIIVRQWGAF